MPRMPSVLPFTPMPSSSPWPIRRRQPARMIKSYSCARRAAASSSMKAKSAVHSVSTPGVLVTAMARAFAAATSI